MKNFRFDHIRAEEGYQEVICHDSLKGIKTLRYTK